MVFLLLFIANTSHVFAQSGPGVTARFANPEFFLDNDTYCVDVEFQSNTAGVEVSGINARFFFDDYLLDFLAFEDFQGGYGRADDASPVSVDNKGLGSFFSFNGQALFINESIEKVNESAAPILLSPTEWTYLFKVCFSIKDVNSLGLDEFCPSIVWDLQNNPADKSFMAGSEGLVITVSGINGCILAQEGAEPFNWEYADLGPNQFGEPATDPDKLNCIPTKSIPLPAWSLALSAMLMMAFVVMRKRFV